MGPQLPEWLRRCSHILINKHQQPRSVQWLNTVFNTFFVFLSHQLLTGSAVYYPVSIKRLANSACLTCLMFGLVHQDYKITQKEGKGATVPGIFKRTLASLLVHLPHVTICTRKPALRSKVYDLIYKFSSLWCHKPGAFTGLINKTEQSCQSHHNPIYFFCVHCTLLWWFCPRCHLDCLATACGQPTEQTKAWTQLVSYFWGQKLLDWSKAETLVTMRNAGKDNI